MKSREREIISENKVICLCVFSLYHLLIFIRFTKKNFLLAYFFVKSERQREFMSLSYVCHGKVFRSLTSYPKLVYSMKTCSWPLCVLWYSWFIPRLNFLVSYSSEPSPGIFFICKHAGWSKDPWCENWNCQLLARCLHPQMKFQNRFEKAQLQYRH